MAQGKNSKTLGRPNTASLGRSNFTLDTSTPLVIHTDKRNQGSEGHVSSGIVLQSDNVFAKSTIAFRDMNGDDVGWLQAHKYLDEDAQNLHQHMSLETSDSSGQVQTRIDIPYGSDTIDLKFTSSNVYVGSGGTFNVTDGVSTFGNNVVVDPSSGNAQMMIDRPASTNNGALNFRTAGTDQWALRQTNDSTTNLYLRNTTNGVNVLKFILGAGNATRMVQRVPGTATTDNNLDANTMEVRLDEASNKLIFRVKYADGTTLKTGEIALA